MEFTVKMQEQDLFCRWKEKMGYEFFIADGVFDETVWREQTYKITFILKEADWENASADLCAWILSEKSGTYWKTWNNIARWTKALLDGGGYPRHVSKADKSFWLSKVSFINLKKSGGRGRADNNVVAGHAARDRLFLQEQLALYGPDIVVCCGKTRPRIADVLYESVLEKEKTSEWKKTADGCDYFYYELEDRAGDKIKRVPVVSFFHPQRIAGHAAFEKWYEDMKKIGGELLVRNIK